MRTSKTPIETHRVPELEKEIRLSDYAGNKFKAIPSRKGMKKAIDRGLVEVNGETARTGKILKGGETITLFESKKERQRPVFRMNLPVLYEDAYLAVVEKPAGIVTSGNAFRTIENALPGVLTESKEKDALIRPQPVHRLDFQTTGVLLVGKTRRVVTALKEMFAKREIHKTYYAITKGDMPAHGEIQDTIKGKSAYTRYQVERIFESRKYGSLNYVRLEPITGRRHQLRIHMAGLGAPILGDQQYAPEGDTPKGRGLFLHALSIVFKHPVDGHIVDLKSPLPAKFKKVMAHASREEE